VLGPAPLFRRGGRHRAVVLVRSEHRPTALTAVRRAVESLSGERRHRGVALAVDVDPH
jgi:primosomal protein N'